ncbi:hypothetical protein BDR07DRAFT_1494512 [Suillus spraguei]|nr:hypothetical protein BDR07DRAFT_1494512 [Suillus spraguei]
MSEEPKPKKAPKAIWNDTETDALITYLHSQHSKIGDGGNFRPQVYTNAATAIAKHKTLGPTKVASHCRNKWQSLKSLYHIIENYRLKTSGTHWDNEIGAGIEGIAASNVWDAYMEKKANHDMCPYQNTGWNNYGQMQDILPSGSSARGCASYCASRAAAAVVDNLSDQASAAPMGADVIAGPTTDVQMGEVEAEEELSWGHVPHNDPIPITGSSELAAAALSALPFSKTLSIGKWTHSDMTGMDGADRTNTNSADTTTGMDTQSLAPPPLTTFMSISQKGSKSKKTKVTKHAAIIADAAITNIKSQPEDSGDGSKVNKPTNAVAMIGMQDALNRLTDTLVT